MSKQCPQTLVQIIRDSPIEFRLTGSRFFKTETPKSDWDFFVCDYEPGLENFLKTYFIQSRDSTTGITSNYEGDPTVATVWINKLRDSTNQENEVHIQVIKKDMFHVKTTAQRIIKDNNLLCKKGALEPKSTKKVNKSIWMAVQRTLLAIRAL